jgi:flagellar basal body-associated protein FliL
MIIQKAKKNKKGLSGAITALILVIASVIIALVVVFFAFGYLGAFTSTPTVTAAGYGTLIKGSNNCWNLTVTLVASNSVTVIGVEYQGSSVGASTALSAGTNTITVPVPKGTYVAGQTYTFTLVLSDGGTVTVSATAS